MGLRGVNLSFVFQWWGQVNYTQVEVNSNGAVFLSGDRADAESYQLHPVELGGSYSIPLRIIAVWQQDLNPSSLGLLERSTSRLWTAFL